MKNNDNYPLLLELSTKLNYSYSDKESLIQNSQDNSDICLLFDVKGNIEFEVPLSKVMFLNKNKSTIQLGLNHICYEYSDSADQLIFYRIDRDDLDSLNPIQISTQYVKKILVDGSQIWPQKLKYESKLHTSEQPNL